MIRGLLGGAVAIPVAGSAAAQEQAQIDLARSSHLHVATAEAVASTAIGGAGTAVVSIETAGYASPGDGGGALYRWVAARPEHAGAVRSADGAWWELARSRDWTPQMFGADQTGVLDAHAAVESWIDACVSQGKVLAAHIGRFLIDGFFSKDLTGDVHVRLGSDVWFVATANTTQAMFELDQTVDDTYRLTWEGGNFDLTDAPFVSATASGSGISLARYKKAWIKDVHFFADQADTASWATWPQNGDTGIGFSQIRDMTIDNCFFEGMSDAGIYPSGSGTSGVNEDYGNVTIQNCHFYNCWQGVAIKREYERFIVQSCTFDSCRGGVSVTGEGQSLYPGRFITIDNNIFRKIGWRPIRVQSDGKAAWITNNKIIDQGRDRDGTTEAGWNRAITLQGVVNGRITGNHFEYEDWTPVADSTMIYYFHYTDHTAVDWHSYNNVHSGNTSRGISTFVAERDVNQGPNWGDDNTLIEVARPLVRQHPESWIGYVSDREMHHVQYVGGPGLSLLVNGQTLASGETNAYVPAVVFATAPDGGIVYDLREGLYSRVGNVVTLWFDVQFRTHWFTSPPEGFWRLSGLPFEGRGGGPVLHLSAAFPPDAGQIVAEVSADHIQFVKHTGDEGSVYLQASDVAKAGRGTSIRVRGQVVYQIGPKLHHRRSTPE